jgi:hypothetical protein
VADGRVVLVAALEVEMLVVHPQQVVARLLAAHHARLAGE